MDRHLGPVPDPEIEDGDPFAAGPFAEAFDDAPLDEPMRPRAAWWRWVAILVALALVVATPFAYVLSRLLG